MSPEASDVGRRSCGSVPAGTRPRRESPRRPPCRRRSGQAGAGSPRLRVNEEILRVVTKRRPPTRRNAVCSRLTFRRHTIASPGDSLAPAPMGPGSMAASRPASGGIKTRTRTNPRSTPVTAATRSTSALQDEDPVCRSESNYEDDSTDESDLLPGPKVSPAEFLVVHAPRVPGSVAARAWVRRGRRGRRPSDRPRPSSSRTRGSVGPSQTGMPGTFEGGIRLEAGQR